MPLININDNPTLKPAPYTRLPNSGLEVPFRGGLYLGGEVPSPLTDSTQANSATTKSGTITAVKGAFGSKASLLDGSTGYYSVPFSSRGNRFKNLAITMWAWINLSTTTNPGAIFSKSSNSGNTGFLFGLFSTGMLFDTVQSSNNGTITTSAGSLPAALTVGTWNLVGFSWNGTSLTSTTTPVQMYVNGVSQALKNVQTGSGTQTDVDTFALLVGNSSWPTDSTNTDGLAKNFFSGAIDHFGWDYRVYSPAEWNDLYHRPFRMFAPAAELVFEAVVQHTSSGGSTGTVNAGATVSGIPGFIGTASAHASSSIVGSSTMKGAATASAHATVSGVGASTAKTTASASPHATVSGVGKSLNPTVGSASPHATVSGVGAETFKSVGTVSASATVSGVGSSLSGHIATITAGATVSGVGKSTAKTTASSNPHATVSGVGAETFKSVGSCSAGATVSGVGQDQDKSSFTINGQATVSGHSLIQDKRAVSTTGQATVSGVAIAHTFTVASASPHATVTGHAEANTSTTASSSAHATVSGAAKSTAQTIASAMGQATDSGVGKSTNKTSGTSSPHATVLGAGASLNKTTGSCSARATLSIVGGSASHTIAGANGHASASATGAPVFKGVVSIQGLTTLNIHGESGATAVGTSNGHATLSIVSNPSIPLTTLMRRFFQGLY